MKTVNIGQLVDKFNAGECSVEEEQVLKGWLHQYNMEGPNGLSDEYLLFASTNMLEAIESARFSKGKKFKLWPRIVAAAAILLVAGASIGFYIYHNIQRLPTNSAVAGITPGTQSATLTLADGKKIVLSGAAGGELAKEGGLRIIKTADGQLVYELAGGDHGAENKLNTLTTAKGETYRLRLPDGSLVWLNAASSLTYAFTLNEHGERRVKLSGEAYFEIAKDKAHPFVVSTDQQQVRVLGTHFNINSYKDESATVTTLLEGAVRVSSGVVTKLLVPGQEAKLDAKGLVVTEANVSLVTAWKNGQMAFQKTNIQSVLRQISRWYDIEVEYQGNVPDYTITGEVSRAESLSSVLKVLELSEVHFELKGRKLLILP